MTQLLSIRFGRSGLDPRLAWLNPPASARFDSATAALLVEPAANTDFWQRTHYGFSADNGHFLGLPLEGDFSLSTHLQFHPVHQYDQAGLMIRADANSWIKTSVEHENEGPPQLGVVVTNAGFSDWSLQDFAAGSREVSLRLERRGPDVTVLYRLSETAGWKPMRVTHWAPPRPGPIHAGLYACSPKGAGFRTEFTRLELDR
jgi:uncharacterized protein